MPFNDIRSSCAYVSESADHVQLLKDKLEIYAKQLSLEVIDLEYDAEYHFLGTPDETLAYILSLDAINFGSGFFPFLKKRPGMSGYFTIASYLKDHFEHHGPFSAHNLTMLKPKDCAHIFKQSLEGKQGELMSLFATALNDLGHYVLKNFEGKFEYLIAAADCSAATLVCSLAQMPLFQDVAQYKGRTIAFYKRAQITVSDLALAFKGQGYGTFEDLDELSIFADNLVPHVLRVDGLLEYDAALSEKIAKGIPLSPQSPEEVEIRATAVHAVEMLLAKLNTHSTTLTARHLDIWLWNKGQLPRYRQLPRHRCPSPYY